MTPNAFDPQQTVSKSVSQRHADVSPQTIEALQTSEARYRDLFEHAEDVIFSCTLDGTITSLNRAAERLLGWPREALIGQHDSKILTPASIALGQERVRRSLAGERLPKLFELEAVRRDGSLVPLEGWARFILDKDGKPSEFQGIYRDITERKQAEAALCQAKEAAEAASQAKSAFLANMSHELRTPLNAIIGYSEMLQEEATELGQEDFVPDLQKIGTAAKHLLALINDILDLSKLEAGKMDLHLETFNIAMLVQEMTTTTRPLAEKNRNALQVRCASDLGTIRADLSKVRQALFNLLSNACKFTEQGAVTLEVAREMVDGAAWITFRVTDTGIGMTPEQMEKLFQAFVQADASSMRKYGGTGLGLAISQRCCQMMGGEITVASALGGGSTCTIRLPAQAIDPRATAGVGPGDVEIEEEPDGEDPASGR